MATPEQLRTWAAKNRAWARETDNRGLAAALDRLAEELDALAPEHDATGAPVASKLNLPTWGDALTRNPRESRRSPAIEG